MKRLRRLSARRKDRHGEGRFLLDGPVLLAEALRWGTPVEAVFAEPGADAELLERARSTDVAVWRVAEDSLAKVLDLVTPRQIVTVAGFAPTDVGEVVSDAAARGVPLLGLVGVQDPGNAGTLVRVAEAAGCAGVVLTPGSVDPWNPKAVRASAGSVLRVPLAVDVDPDDLLSRSAAAALEVVATVNSGGVAPEEVGLAAGCVVLVGAEAAGIAPELSERSTVRVEVPMTGDVESLNAAVSGALVVFEAARQRRSPAARSAEGRENAPKAVGSGDHSVGQNAGGDTGSPQEHIR